jgi:hypothetical protein
MSPACGCQQSVRLERLLSEAAADSWPHSGLAEFLSIAGVTCRSCDLHQRGDDPVGVGVMRAPHPSHAAAAQQLDQAVAPKRDLIHPQPVFPRVSVLAICPQSTQSIRPCEGGASPLGTVRLGRACNTVWMSKNAKPLRAEGLDPDDPAVIAAIDLVQWELSLGG